MKLPLRSLLLSPVLLLAVAAPASAQGPPGPCPAGFTATFDVANISGEDRNDNDVVCVKAVPGRGLPFGVVVMDDR